MSVGFGFSAGDFIAAIELVGTVIDALRSSGEAGTEYRELVAQLFSLETALIQVKCLDEGSANGEIVALRQAAAQCRRPIDEFWKKAKRFQPYLSISGETRRIGAKAGWMRIRWALCNRDDVAQLKQDLMGHTQSILLLLATVQRSTANIHEQRQESRYRELTTRFQKSYLGCMQRLATIYNQGKELLASTKQILLINARIFQVVLLTYDYVTRIPTAVERQQPVYLLGAIGRYSPFHLEFVRSAEALIAVLKINFKKHGNAPQKIDRKEFVIQDSTIARDIDLNKDWDLCFYPGQRVDMSMVYYTLQEATDITPDLGLKCPRCDTCAGKTSQNFITCLSCGMAFRREFQELSELEDSESDDIEPPRSSLTKNKDTREPQRLGSHRVKVREPDSEQDEPGMFQRVRIHDTVVPSDPPDPWQLVPPWQPRPTLGHSLKSLSLAPPPFNYGYDLPCEFSFVGCELRFHPEAFESWIDHSITHFGGHGPPSRTVCTSCDKEFNASSSHNDTDRNWRRRMTHIGRHFYESQRGDGVELNHRRPDFMIIDYMKKVDVLSREDYEVTTKYTERPCCDNTFPVGWRPLEMRAKEERSSGASYDLKKEKHQLRKDRDKRRGRTDRNRS